jgi:dolichol-phosphate mannosyltransferase
MSFVDPTRPTVSIVVPMHNEAGAVDDLLAGIAQAAGDLIAIEIIVIDDGSDDDTLARLQAAQRTYPNLRVLTHKTAAGQSAAVHSGVNAARAELCCTLDGDGQNPPENLPKLWNILLEDTDEKVGLVAGQRKGRKDTLSKRLASRFANALRQRVLRDGTRDTGCGLKGFRRDAFLALPYFDHMHRYLPAVFGAYGWEIMHVDVTHRARETGHSKYNNFGRAIAGVWDLFGVVWLLRRAKKSRPQELPNQ